MKKVYFEEENHTINNDNQYNSSSDDDETPGFFDIQNINKKKFKPDANEITVIGTKIIIEYDGEDETPSFFLTTQANDEDKPNDDDETPSFFVIDKTKVEQKEIYKIKGFNEIEPDDKETPSFFVEPKKEDTINFFKSDRIVIPIKIKQPGNVKVLFSLTQSQKQIKK